MIPLTIPWFAGLIKALAMEGFSFLEACFSMDLMMFLRFSMDFLKSLKTLRFYRFTPTFKNYCGC